MTAFPSSIGRIYIVADGMGGHQDGGVAAEVVVRRLEECLGHAGAREVESNLRQAFEAANTAVYQKAQRGDARRPSMGSTVVVAVFSGTRLWIGHVGDSRAYLYRDQRLKQLTRDHTIIQRMIDAGMLSPKDARNHPDASVLDRALGTRSSVEAEICSVDLEDGDAILLCSDGLSSYATAQEIAQTIGSAKASQCVADDLVDLALGKGGPDNVTVQFVRYGAITTSPQEGRRVPETEHVSWRSLAVFALLLLSAALVVLVGIWASSSSSSTAPSGAIPFALVVRYPDHGPGSSLAALDQAMRTLHTADPATHEIRRIDLQPLGDDEPAPAQSFSATSEERVTSPIPGLLEPAVDPSPASALGLHTFVLRIDADNGNTTLTTSERGEIAPPEPETTRREVPHVEGR